MSVDVDATSERLGVDPAALQGVVDNYEARNPDEPAIVEIHAYRHAIGIVELEEGICHNSADPEPYALVNFYGYVFPFHPKDVEYIGNVFENSGLEDDR